MTKYLYRLNTCTTNAFKLLGFKTKIFCTEGAYDDNTAMPPTRRIFMLIIEPENKKTMLHIKSQTTQSQRISN
jgi:hypothetical protein